MQLNYLSFKYVLFDVAFVKVLFSNYEVDGAGKTALPIHLVLSFVYSILQGCFASHSTHVISNYDIAYV